MERVAGPTQDVARRTEVLSWLGLPVVLLVFTYLRWFASGPFALPLSQLVFITVPVLAATFASGAAWAAPTRSRPRVIWALVAVATSLLTIGEAYTSWRLLGNGLSPGVVFVVDAVNALALVAIVALLATIARLDQLGTVGAARLVLDLTILVVLGFSVALEAWLRGPFQGQSTDYVVLMVLYALGGFVLLGLNLFVVLRLQRPVRGPWVLLLNASIALFSVGMLLWPLWSLAATGVTSDRQIEILTSNVFLAGYYLAFVSALLKLTGPSAGSAVVGAEVRSIRNPWADVGVSVLVLAAVVALGVSALRAEPGTSRALTFASLAVATACLAARTALSDQERSRLLTETMTDRVTGAPNPRSFAGRLAAYLVSMRRFGEPFGLIVADLDDFAEFALAHGRDTGDIQLAAVAGVLRRAFEGTGHVFRLSGDGFAVLVPATRREDVARDAERVRDLIATLDSGLGTAPVSASVGFAMSPDDALTDKQLVRRADAALAWAKRHGKNRVAGWDARVGRALQAEELGLPVDQTRLGVARALSAAADARDPANFVHSRNVAALSRVLAEELGFEPGALQRIHLAALLHDVGRIAMPSMGPGARARRPVGEHALLGERLLAPLDIEGVARWVRGHHERWDGQGGPDGLAGEDIALESRIIALADAYDRMTSTAPAGRGLSRAAALQEIDLGMGSRFDPVLAERFIVVVATMDAVGWTDEWPAA